MTHGETLGRDLGRVPAGLGARGVDEALQPGLFGDVSSALRRAGDEPREGDREGKVEEMILFVVPGTPVGKGRPRFAKRGNFVTTYTPEKTASYENLVKVKAEEAMIGRRLIEGAVSVEIELLITPPASWSQKKQREALSGRIFPTSKPDLDNVIKGLFDACNEIVWKDDKQVAALQVTKRYAVKAEACMRVTAL